MTEAASPAPNDSRTSSLLRARLAVLGLLTLLGAVIWLWRTSADPEREFQEALEALQANDLPRVQRQIERLSRRREYEPQVHFLQAATLLQQGQAGAALEELEQMKPLPQLKKSAQLLRGECYYREGRLAEAERLFLQIEREHPDEPTAVRWLAAIYYDLGAMDYALPWLDKLCQLDPEDYSPHRLKAIIHFDFERFAQAIEAYRAALACAPPPEVTDEMQRDLAQALIAEKRFDEALAELRLLPETGETLALAADCYQATNRLAQARETWLAARQQAPQHPRVLQVGGKLHLDAGETDQAIALLEELLRVDPHHTEARYTLAQAWRRLGDQQRSEQELARREVSYQLREQLSELNKQATRDPYNPDLREEIARICDQLGKTDLARMWRLAAAACRKAQAPSPD